MEGYEGGGGGGGIGAIIMMIIQLAIGILMIASMWKIYAKAGKPGWAAIVPIYNIIVLLEIIGRPIWWIILYFIPLVNFVIMILVFLDLAKKFGKSAGYGILMIILPFIFIPALGFGSAKYEG